MQNHIRTDNELKNLGWYHINAINGVINLKRKQFYEDHILLKLAQISKIVQTNVGGIG
jgi:hypothetical protein